MWNRKALWGWASLGAKFSCVWLSKGTCLKKLLIHLINQGIAQAKELPRGCQDSPSTSVPLYATNLGIALTKFFVISSISMRYLKQMKHTMSTISTAQF